MKNLNLKIIQKHLHSKDSWTKFKKNLKKIFGAIVQPLSQVSGKWIPTVGQDHIVQTVKGMPEATTDSCWVTVQNQNLESHARNQRE